MHIIETLAGITDWIATIVLMTGLCLTLLSAARTVLKANAPVFETMSGEILRDLRISLGRWLLVALEILIVSDILYSIAHRTLDEIAFLAAVVIIRTVLAYFLDHEVARMEQSRTRDTHSTAI